MMIYVVTHKNFKPIVKSKLYKTLLVGADNNQGDKDYLRDNDFPGNISSKNKNYCELTGVYWIWKRSKEDIVGICHYRRYFTTSKHFPRTHILDKAKTAEIFEQYDIILPARDKNIFYGMNAKEQFAYCHDVTIWDQCKAIIESNCSDYLKDINWFEQQTTAYCYNMMISNKAIYDAYCEWLFPILFEMEKQIDLSQYNSYNQRMFGFVSERLLNIWVHHQHLKVKELPIYNSEDKRSALKKAYDNIKIKAIMKKEIKKRRGNHLECKD